MARRFNLARSVGWFTSLYPLRVPLEALDTSLEQLLTKVQAALADVPGNGIGFGALRYAATDVVTNTLQKPLPQVSFNYLGWNHGKDAAACRKDPLGAAECSWLDVVDWPDENVPSDSPVMVNCWFGARGELTVSWGYASPLLQDSVIRAIAQRCNNTVQQIAQQPELLVKVGKDEQHKAMELKLCRWDTLYEKRWSRHAAGGYLNGLAVALVYQGKVVYTGTRGNMKESTRIRFGSLSKVVHKPLQLLMQLLPQVLLANLAVQLVNSCSVPGWDEPAAPLFLREVSHTQQTNVLWT